MAEFIADSPRLLRLDLRENEIKTGGLMALSLALKVNTSLLRLDLDREPKKETVSMWEGEGGGGLKEAECGRKLMCVWKLLTKRADRRKKSGSEKITGDLF